MKNYLMTVIFGLCCLLSTAVVNADEASALDAIIGAEMFHNEVNIATWVSTQNVTPVRALIDNFFTANDTSGCDMEQLMNVTYHVGQADEKITDAEHNLMLAETYLMGATAKILAAWDAYGNEQWNDAETLANQGHYDLTQAFSKQYFANIWASGATTHINLAIAFIP